MRGVVVAGALVALGASAACSAGAARSAPAEAAHAARTVDARPRESKLDPPLAPGKAEAFLVLDTGSDQMGGRAKEAGLVPGSPVREP